MYKLGLIDVSETCLLAPVLAGKSVTLPDCYWTDRTNVETSGLNVTLKTRIVRVLSFTSNGQEGA